MPGLLGPVPNPGTVPLSSQAFFGVRGRGGEGVVGRGSKRVTCNAAVDIGRRRVVAIADIQAGEEVTLDYCREPLPKMYLEPAHRAFLQKPPLVI